MISKNTYKLINFSNLSLLFVSFVIFLFTCQVSYSQNINCTNDTPFFSIDLTGDPAGVWTSPAVVRNGDCCGGGNNQSNCIELEIILDPGAEGIIFDVETGANPPGALYYQVDCDGPPQPSGSQSICLTGVGPHIITYCKPGNNTNTYSLTSVPSPVVSNDVNITVDGSCGEIIDVDGLDQNSISWNSVGPGFVGEYNNYLSDENGNNIGSTGVPYTGEETLLVNPDQNAPNQILYEVCGTPSGSCSVGNFCDTVAVNIFPSLFVDIVPEAPAICFGGTDVTLTANTIGGTPPLQFDWSTGENTQDIDVSSPGVYFVEVSDATGCAFAQDTVEVVEFTEDIEANAGANILVCDPPTPTVQLQGEVTGTTTGEWTGGNGTFSPSNEDLNATYTPTGSEMASGSVELILTTTNTGTCPPDSDTVTILLPPYLEEVQGVIEDALCFEDCNGQITANPVGGQSPFDFEWSEGGTVLTQTSQTVSGLCAGNYSVTITDAAGCEITENFVVDEPDELTGDVITQDALCFESCDGEIEVDNVAGGTTPYQYNLNGGANQGSNIFDDLCADDYDVNIVDDNNCVLELTAEINEPDELIVDDLIITAATCGLDNGEFDLTVQGGTAPYSFDLDGNVQASGDFSNLAPDNYNVTVTDDNGCELIVLVEIIDTPEPEVFVDVINNLDCAGDSDGSVLLGVNNAPPSVTYSLNGGATQTSNQFTSLTEGGYTVEITDGNGCTHEVAFQITAPDPIVINEVVTDALCFEDCNGEIELNPTGGVGPYSYSNDNGINFGTTNEFTGLCADDYDVIVQDQNNCQELMVITIDEPDELQASTIIEDASCFDLCDGEITVDNPQGGTAPYEYSENGNPAQTSPTLTGLCAGNNDISVIDDNGCELILSELVGEPDELVVDDLIITAATCGLDNGEFDLTVQGGTAPYSFDLDGNVQASGDFSNLAPDNYNVTVTDDNGCELIVPVEIIDTPEPEVFVDAIQDLSCAGSNNGSVIVGVTNAEPTVTYSLNGGTPQASNEFTGLAEDTYTVEIVDGNGCIDEITFSVDAPDNLTFTTTATGVSCHGDCDGEIEIDANGGVPPYLYSGDNGVTFTNDNPLTGLCGGTAEIGVVVQDDNGCLANTLVIVPEPDPIDATFTLTDPTCHDGCDGSIDVDAIGGTPPYQYSVNGGALQSSTILTDLCSGTHDILIVDVNGCEFNTTQTLNNPPQMELDLISMTPSNCGFNNGSFEVEASGLNPPFQYSIPGTGLQATGEFNNVSGGAYEVTVVDALGCEYSDFFGVNDVEMDGELIGKTYVSCFGGSDGTVEVINTDGAEPITYELNNSGTTQPSGLFTGLPAGNHIITIYDAGLCVHNISFSIDEPDEIQFDLTSEDVICNGDATGSVEVINVIGGVGNYQYSIDGGFVFQGNNEFGNLEAGMYNVITMDENNCTVTETIEVEEPDPVDFNATTFDVDCNGNNTGVIQVIASGGDGNYSYSNDSGTTFQGFNSFVGLSAGTYDIVVTDLLDCEASGQVVVEEPPALTSSFNIEDLSCFESCDGSVITLPSGGVTPYVFSNDNGTTFSTNPNFSGYCEGTFDILIRDDNDCQHSESFTINQPDPLDADLATTDALCFESCDGEIEVINVSGGTTPYEYSIDSNPFQSNATFDNLCADGFNIEVQDENECSITLNGSIDEPADLSPSIVSVTNTTCGLDNGVFTVDVTGGTSPYTYELNGVQQGSGTFNNLAPDTYNVEITDDNDCVTTIEVEVEATPEPTLSVNSLSNLSCFESDDGSVTLTSTNAIAPVTYSLNGGAPQGSNTFNDLEEGSYSVELTDGNGCTATTTFNITSPDELIANATAEDALCFNQCTGEIEANGTGGTMPFAYSANGGGNYSSSNNFGDLCIGTYEVYILDDNGCIASTTVEIDEPSELTFDASETPSTCSDSNGELVIDANGGTPTYNYSNDNGTTFVGGNTFGGLAAGNYDIVVQDENGCLAFGTETLTDEPSPVIQNANSTDPTCFAGSDGEITVNASGGTGTLNYSLNGGALQGSNTFTGLSSGNYTVTVIDENDCEDEINVTIDDPQEVDFTVVGNDLTCFENSSGSIEFTATGGTSPYQYSIDNGASFTGGSTANFLSAGTYELVVQDVFGCQATGTVTINQPALLEIDDIQVTDALCKSSCDGEIELTVVGGTTPYSYDWVQTGTPSSQNVAQDLCAGNYDFVVTDDNGCLVGSNTNVNEPDTVEIDNIINSNVQCYEDCSGEIEIISNDAVTFSIDGGATFQASNVFTDLCADEYDILVETIDGCQGAGSSHIWQPDSIELDISNDTTICHGFYHEVIASASGGVPPFNYTWNTGDNGAVLGVTATSNETYTVEVIDNNGCRGPEISMNLSVFDPLTVNAFQDTSICQGDTVSLSAEGVGGVPFYEYEWSTGETDSLITVSPNSNTTYNVSVKDQCEAIVDVNLSIELFETPEISFTADNPTGCAPHTVTLSNDTPSGQVGSNCIWLVGDEEYNDCGALTLTFDEEGCWDVSLFVESPNGCISEGDMESYICVDEYPEADFIFFPEEPTIFESDVDFFNESIGADFYTWSFGGLGSSNEENPMFPFNGIDGETDFSICLEAETTLGCTDVICKEITIYDEFVMYVPNTFTPDGDQYNNTFFPVFPENADIVEFELLIFNRWGEVLFESRNPNIGWDGTYGDRKVKDGTYIWRIQMIEGRDLNRREYTGHVNVLR